MKDFFSLSRIERYAYPGARINYKNLPVIDNSDSLWMMTKEGDWICGIYSANKDPSIGCVIHFYDQGENLRAAENTLRMYRALGLATLCFDYRGYGASGGKPNEKKFYQDAIFAYDWLKENHANAKVILSGRSMGSAVATYLAVERDVEAMILFSPPTNMVDTVSHIFPPDEIIIEEALPFRFDNSSRAASISCPVLVVQGDCDRVVPVVMSREIARALSEYTEVSIHEVPGAGHDELFRLGGELLWTEIEKFLESQRLTAASASGDRSQTFPLLRKIGIGQS